jgi:hypothetical protein
MKIQSILDAEVEVHRAVWATNLVYGNGKNPFKDDNERALYINTCCKNAIISLQEYLKDAESTLF